MPVAALLCTATSLALAVPHNLPKIVLGSASRTRRDILTALGVTFEVEKPDIDEKAIRHPDVETLVLMLGRAKAAALLEGERGERLRREGAWLLTGDQVVVCAGEVLEKPENEAEARRFIGAYATSSPSTIGSAVLTDASSGQQWETVFKATVHFDPIPEETVDKLVREGEIFYCAGGCAALKWRQHDLPASTPNLTPRTCPAPT
jgi:septum formation protein